MQVILRKTGYTISTRSLSLSRSSKQLEMLEISRLFYIPLVQMLPSRVIKGFVSIQYVTNCERFQWQSEIQDEKCHTC